jgi:hypothetical protein
MTRRFSLRHGTQHIFTLRVKRPFTRRKAQLTYELAGVLDVADFLKQL